MTTAAAVKEARQKLLDVVAFLDEVLAAAQKPISIPVLPEAQFGLQDPAEFYDYIRGDAGELFPTMSQAQLDGLKATLTWGAGRLPTSWMAYVLATEYHETGKRMQGVKEGFDVSDAWRARNLRYYPWYGRGKVQLTWESNYKRATAELRKLGFDVDLIANPDKALDNEVGAAIIVIGMIEGWFTGKKLRDYIPQTPELKHFIAARKIINGTDKAELIAGYAMSFYKALVAGEWQ